MELSESEVREYVENIPSVPVEEIGSIVTINPKQIDFFASKKKKNTKKHKFPKKRFKKVTFVYPFSFHYRETQKHFKIN